MYPTFPAFRRQPPDAPPGRFDTLPLSSRGFPLLAGLGFAFCQQARRYARPNRPGAPGSPYGPQVHLSRRAGTPDPASRRRRYLQLQAGERLPGEDSHFPDRVHSQAHWHVRCFERTCLQHATARPPHHHPLFSDRRPDPLRLPRRSCHTPVRDSPGGAAPRIRTPRGSLSIYHMSLAKRQPMRRS